MADPPRPKIIDTREQVELELSGPTVRAKLDAGDYSVEGLEHLIALERKSLDDLCGSLTVGRERFMRAVERMRERPYRGIVIEARWEDIRRGWYRSRMHANSLVGSVVALCADDVPVYFCGDHKGAAVFADRWLDKCAKRALARQEGGA